ncbi:MAG: phosphodiester glycosidase family protein [Chthoniobacterales bacterium]
MRRLSVALVALSLCASLRGQWTVGSAQSEFSADRVVEHRRVAVRAADERQARFDLALFSAKSATLRVVDNGGQERDLAVAMQQANCIAGVNGGYFDPQFAPIGLRVIEGKTTSPLIRAHLLTGVLSASRDHGLEIVRVGEFSRKRQLDAAVECGPFLVDLGRPVRGLDDTRVARRTFAAVARGGRAVIGVCDGATLAQLGEMLASTPLADGFTVWRAMNLDGGSSTAFWFRHGNGTVFSIPEAKTVRDFIGVVPR